MPFTAFFPGLFSEVLGARLFPAPGDRLIKDGIGKQTQDFAQHPHLLRNRAVGDVRVNGFDGTARKLIGFE